MAASGSDRFRETESVRLPHRRQFEAQRDYKGFCQTLRTIMDKLRSDRILFGTDGPVVSPSFTPKDWVDVIRALPEKSPEGITFTDDEVEGILGRNAEKLIA